MKILIPLFITTIVSATGLIWSYNGELKKLSAWKEAHEKYDLIRMKEIRSDIKEIKTGQRNIYNLLLRLKK